MSCAGSELPGAHPRRPHVGLGGFLCWKSWYPVAGWKSLLAHFGLGFLFVVYSGT